jgi:predicted ferric reductase
MKTNNAEMIDLENMPPVVSLETLALMFIAVLVGVLMAVVALPTWVPGLSASVFGSEPKVFWYLSRGSAIIAFIILWLSMAFGLIITNKIARMWPGGPVAFDLHQYTSILGLAFAFFHALILMGDAYINYTLVQVLLPFESVNYQPLWVGIGQIGFYLWLVVVLSFYVRSRIGTRAWRLVHYLSYLLFGMTMLHGITSGTDSALPGVTLMYWIAGGTLLFLTIYRVLINLKLPARKVKREPA